MPHAGIKFAEDGSLLVAGYGQREELSDSDLLALHISTVGELLGLEQADIEYMQDDIAFAVGGNADHLYLIGNTIDPDQFSHLVIRRYGLIVSVRDTQDRNNVIYAFPNPFNHTLAIRVDIPTTGSYVSVFDLNGRLCLQQDLHGNAEVNISYSDDLLINGPAIRHS